MRITRILAAATIVVAGALVSTTPAHAAATPDCTKVKTTNLGNGWYLNTPGYDARRGSSFACYLELGDRNAAVRYLQWTIQYCYDDGEIVVDGRYGTQTRQIVKAVQRHSGVPQTGIYGPRTRAGMAWRLYNAKLNRYSEQCYRL